MWHIFADRNDALLTTLRTPKKPKSKRPNLLSGLGITTKKEPTTVRKASTPGPEGTREAPILVDHDDALPGAAGPSNQPSTILKPSLSYAPGADQALIQSGLTGQKRKRSAIVTITGENGKKKKKVDESAFHPDLQKAITEMKVLIASGAFSGYVFYHETVDLTYGMQSHGNRKGSFPPRSSLRLRSSPSSLSDWTSTTMISFH